MSKPREFWICEVWDPVICTRYVFDDPYDKKLNVLGKKHNFTMTRVREVIEGEPDYKALAQQLAEALNYIRMHRYIHGDELFDHCTLALAKYHKAIGNEGEEK